jgi:hypothetical protein
MVKPLEKITGEIAITEHIHAAGFVAQAASSRARNAPVHWLVGYSTCHAKLNR